MFRHPEHFLNSEVDPRSLLEILGTRLKVAIDVEPCSTPTELHSGTLTENALTRPWYIYSVNFMVGNLLSGISIDSDPDVIRHCVRGGIVLIEGLARLGAFEAIADKGMIIFAGPGPMITVSDLPFMVFRQIVCPRMHSGYRIGV